MMTEQQKTREILKTRDRIDRAYATLRRTSQAYLRTREANFAASKAYQTACTAWYALEQPEETRVPE